MNLLLMQGNAKTISLADESVHCCVTSPPYWNLRDYGHPDQIGLEETPELYLETMWSLFDDIKLKLKDEGNCFVNLGDSYSSTGANNQPAHTQFGKPTNPGRQTSGHKVENLPAKCMCLIPSRFAWGMVERGWVLRNEIVWSKVNHMPESVTDRLTKAHEMIYHFVKQQKYYYDLDAIREPHKTQSVERYQRSVNLGGNAVQGKILQREEQNTGVPRTAPKWFRDGIEPESFGSPRAGASRDEHSDNNCRTTAGLHDGRNPLDVKHENGKNPGDVIELNAEYTTSELIERWKQMHPEDWTQPHDVWQINTQPYADAHFAVFPIELVRRPILSGCPVGGHVLDPFGGSGTVAEFCRKNDRECTIFELNPEYESLIKERSMANYPTLEAYV